MGLQNRNCNYEDVERAFEKHRKEVDKISMAAVLWGGALERNFRRLLISVLLLLPLFSLIFVGYNWDYFSVQVSKYTGQYAEVPARITSVTTAIDRSTVELKTEDGREFRTTVPAGSVKKGAQYTVSYNGVSPEHCFIKEIKSPVELFSDPVPMVTGIIAAFLVLMLCIGLPYFKYLISQRRKYDKLMDYSSFQQMVRREVSEKQ